MPDIDVEDMKRMLESRGWKQYCENIEELIHAQVLSIENCNTLEDFQRVKNTVRAWKMALEYPNTLIARQESPA